MRYIFNTIKFIILQIGKLFTYQLRLIYLLYYPINKELKEEIGEVYTKEKSKKRIKEIDIVRANNVYTTLWSHAGTVLAFALSVFSIVFSLVWTIFSFYSDDIRNMVFINGEKGIIIIFLLFIINIIIVFVSPLLLRKIIDHLSSESYAVLSLSNLNQSQVLTFIALKYWELCDTFCKSIKFGDEIKQLESCEGNEAFSKLFNKKRKAEWIEIFESFNEIAVKFKADSYKLISNSKALKHEATGKLNILAVEFSHHITKFSPPIFESRLDSMLNSSETILYLLKNSEFKSEEFYYEFDETLCEISSIINDIELRRKRALFQLIAFDNIHSYIIGLASATSTSQSLKIFSRGLSKLIEQPIDGIKQARQNEDFKALLHRSKAHYGFDLLIVLENFYLKNYMGKKEWKVPSILDKIKHDKNYYINDNARDLLENIRENLVEKYSIAMERISESFKKEFGDLLKREKKPNTYILIYGYSRIVKNVLQKNHHLLKDNKVKIFVMKEDNRDMLDTRILRFELNDKKGMEIRNSFTSSDDFFKSILRKNDLLIMMAGAEAYDKENSRLFHTNNYKERVEGLLTYLRKNSDKKPQPNFWIVAGNYKIYNKFPALNLSGMARGREFFVDHYDKVDVYNFDDLGVDVRLITD